MYAIRSYYDWNPADPYDAFDMPARLRSFRAQEHFRSDLKQKRELAGEKNLNTFIRFRNNFV